MTMNANPVSNLDAHPACVCGKGKKRGFLCWPCYEASDEKREARQARLDPPPVQPGKEVHTMKKLGIILATAAMTIGLVGVSPAQANRDTGWPLPVQSNRDTGWPLP